MASRLITDLHPDLQTLCQQFLNLCTTQGLDILVICTYRSSAEQDALFAIGRTVNPDAQIVTRAQGGFSPHNATNSDGSPCAKAFDAVPISNGKIDWSGTSPAWKTMFALGSQLGLDLGANFPAGLKDSDHFQLSNWKDIPCQS